MSSSRESKSTNSEVLPSGKHGTKRVLSTGEEKSKLMRIDDARVPPVILEIKQLSSTQTSLNREALLEDISDKDSDSESVMANANDDADDEDSEDESSFGQDDDEENSMPGQSDEEESSVQQSENEEESDQSIYGRNEHSDVDSIYSSYDEEKSQSNSEADDYCLSGAEERSEDEENDGYYNEHEALTSRQALRWIRKEYEDSDVDGHQLNNMINEMDTDELNDLIATLLKEYSEGIDSTPFNFIKEIIQAIRSTIDYDSSLLSECLQQAIRNDDVDEVKFFKDLGADVEQGIAYAITANSYDMLGVLEAEVNEESVTAAAEGNHVSALGYFLEEDFSDSSQFALSIAIKNNNPLIAQTVCEYAEISQAYDLVEYLVKEKGENFIPILFENFEVKELLNEVYENDGDGDLSRLVLEYAKLEGSASLQDFFDGFEKKLTFEPSLLIYPLGEFNGDSKLKIIREAIDKKTNTISDEGRLAANFIGVNLSVANHYLTRTSQHQFLPHHAETYFRSAKHPLSIFVTAKKAQYKPNNIIPEAKASTANGGAANTGLYHPPLDNLAAFKNIQAAAAAQMTPCLSGDSRLYDEHLINRHNMCRYIVDKLKPDNTAIKINFFNDYPCIMVFIESPHVNLIEKIDAKKEVMLGWVEILISFFVGMVNYAAQEKGIDIELVRRSSFGFLSPTIAPCGQSFRLSLGLIPRDYADILIDGLKKLNATLTKIDEYSIDNTRHVLDVSLPQNYFLKDIRYQKYLESSSRQLAAPKAENILQLVWAKVEKGGKTAAVNLMRTALARDGLASEVYRLLGHSTTGNNLDYAAVLLNALRWGFSGVVLTASNKNLTYSRKTEVRFPKILTKHTEIKDINFFKFIETILVSINASLKSNALTDLIQASQTENNAAIKKCIDNKTVADIYYYLEMMNELSFSYSIATYEGHKLDDFGSESETEDVSENVEETVYAKKAIVRNGMRAILASLHAGSTHLYPDYLVENSKKISLFIHGAYYETNNAVKLIEKFSVEKTISKSKIIVCDINACVSAAKNLQTLSINELSNIKVMVVDVTSATCNQQNKSIENFKANKNLEILFLVSSGLKNEQSGKDRNPYGTIRIFTKDKSQLEKALLFIKNTETPIKMGFAHHCRRMMKDNGNIPRNNVILGLNTSAFFSSSRNEIQIKKVQDQVRQRIVRMPV